MSEFLYVAPRTASFWFLVFFLLCGFYGAPEEQAQGFVLASFAGLRLLWVWSDVLKERDKEQI